MRRSEKEITDPREIDAILQRAPVCRIALAAENSPYVVPVNFAATSKHLYFHSAKSGLKVDMLRKNPFICFEVDLPGGVVKGKTACAWGMAYQSVIGFGRAFFVEDRAEKEEALIRLMKKYAPGEPLDFPADALDRVCVIGVRIEKVTGKRSG
ncbi:MAG: pyridoxamine 5'-phosphate oxidase family protein [Smithellaceae bacterium]|nr:pyridoxamine 5'-phosphate oxidase family protein [Smithellaceae bacterium]NLX52807.1 pyridoxamine 5'-phosphate oxidase family protein [Deltaproteobacteria bacterium]